MNYCNALCSGEDFVPIETVLNELCPKFHCILKRRVEDHSPFQFVEEIRCLKL